ncbi:hypothetical protein DCD74_04635 [Lysobacter oculi]|uniref:Uncharacterized protein n=1 Tax=Solilutibacter oculi TaxID=2698682 RepID=A0A344J4W6_9GAMM|nr:hypothetical protein [Lysobacter oculi]AXA84076.1 hypothetical protein DCD74_04635 [Lysobacter oculi]
MSTSHRSSSASATCHLEWRPSRLIAAWLLALAVLAPLSLLYSNLPRGVAWLLAPAWCAVALHAWHRYRNTPSRYLRVHAEGPLEVDGVPMPDWRLHWRGPLAFISWRDAGGRRGAVSFWPDTLPADVRRELRLATPASVGTSSTAGMAP